MSKLFHSFMLGLFFCLLILIYIGILTISFSPADSLSSYTAPMVVFLGLMLVGSKVISGGYENFSKSAPQFSVLILIVFLVFYKSDHLALPMFLGSDKIVSEEVCSLQSIETSRFGSRLTAACEDNYLSVPLNTFVEYENLDLRKQRTGSCLLVSIKRNAFGLMVDVLENCSH